MTSEELQMAKDNSRYSPVSNWPRSRDSRGCVRERGPALSTDDLRRHDGAPRLSPQGREEWENEWATVAFVFDGDKGLDSKTGASAGRYVYVTSTPPHNRKLLTLVRKYPSTLAFLCYISAVVTILLVLQVVARG